jgi:phage tail sheath protein FI
MAESIISPGVFQRENDISFVQPAPIAAGAAFIGPTVKGPDNQPTIVTSYNDYTRKFGETFTSASNIYEFLTSVAVKNYFSQGGQTALVTRVTSGSYTGAVSTNLFAGLNKASGSGLIASQSAVNQQYAITYAGTTYTFIATDQDDFVDNIGTNTWTFPTGSSASNTAGNLENAINSVDIPFIADNSGATLIITSSVAGTPYNTVTFSTGSIGGLAPNYTLFTLAGGTDQVPFTLTTLGKGVTYNNATGAADPGAMNSDGSLISGSSDNVRFQIANVNSALGTFTVLVRQGDDNTNNQVILETFTNVSLDPKSDNYIENVIGNQYMTVSTDSSTGTSYNYLQGTFRNRSNYVRVSSVTLKTPDYLKNDGITVNTDAAGNLFSTYLPRAASGSFYNATGTVKPGAKYFADITNASTDIQGLTGTNYTTAISLLSNKDDYQFNIISAPGLIYQNAAGNAGAKATLDSIISLAESRGDCIAVVDLVKTGSIISDVTTQAVSINSSYAATYWPWVQIQSATGRNEYVPAGTIIPGVYAFTDAATAPWFAPAGLVRGGLPGVIQAERKLTKGDRDLLYAAKVNPIATFPGTGISVFGQKTLQTKASALDRVNVRRLLIELKKFIGDQAKNLVFEQNTIATRNKFLATVNPYLESVVQRQGLYAYRVVMDDTNNTADVVDRNQLVGQIYIQPTKTIEFVVLDFVVEPTGATFA